MDYLTAHTSLSPIRRGFAPSFVNDKKRCTRHAAASDKVYQLLAHGRWFSPGIPASSTTKICRHDIAEILLKVALSTKNQIIQTIEAYNLYHIMNSVHISTKFEYKGSNSLYSVHISPYIWMLNIKQPTNMNSVHFPYMGMLMICNLHFVWYMFLDNISV